MTLQTEGPISMDDISIEIGNAPGTAVRMGMNSFRTLANILAPGTIAISDFYGLERGYELLGNAGVWDQNPAHVGYWEEFYNSGTQIGVISPTSVFDPGGNEREVARVSQLADSDSVRLVMAHLPAGGVVPQNWFSQIMMQNTTSGLWVWLNSADADYTADSNGVTIWRWFGVTDPIIVSGQGFKVWLRGLIDGGSQPLGHEMTITAGTEAAVGWNGWSSSTHTGGGSTWGSVDNAIPAGIAEWSQIVALNTGITPSNFQIHVLPASVATLSPRIIVTCYIMPANTVYFGPFFLSTSSAANDLTIGTCSYYQPSGSSILTPGTQFRFTFEYE